jgi:hypothetical protein
VIEIIGTRYLYSCFGRVESLNGEPVASAKVYAIPIDKTLKQSEARTDEKGEFRIKELSPKSEYMIQLNTNEIDRSEPKSVQIKM